MTPGRDTRERSTHHRSVSHDDPMTRHPWEEYPSKVGLAWSPQDEAPVRGVPITGRSRMITPGRDTRERSTHHQSVSHDGPMTRHPWEEYPSPAGLAWCPITRHHWEECPSLVGLARWPHNETSLGGVPISGSSRTMAPWRDTCERSTHHRSVLHDVPLTRHPCKEYPSLDCLARWPHYETLLRDTLPRSAIPVII